MVRLIQFNDQWYQQCMWSGAHLTERYGVPNKKGEREGSFADAACAVAYWSKMASHEVEKPIPKDKLEKVFDSIYRDLKLGKVKHQLVPAPKLTPTTLDFSYRERCTWMHNPGLYIKVEEDMRMKNNKDKSTREKCFTLYDVELDKDPQHIDTTKLEQPTSIMLPAPFEVGQLIYTGYKAGDAIVLAQGNGFPKNEIAEHIFLNNKNQFDILGNALVLLRERNLIDDFKKRSEKDSKEKKDKKKKDRPNVSTYLSKELKNIYDKIPDPEPGERQRKRKREATSSSSSSSSTSSR